MKINGVPGRYPDWRGNGTGNDDFAGAKHFIEGRQEVRSMSDDMHELAGESFEIGRVGEKRLVTKDACAQAA